MKQAAMKNARSLTKGKKRTVIILIGAIAVMVSLVVASVPLYRLFCQITGYGGTPKISQGIETAEDDIRIGTRDFTVRFDNNISTRLPWNFYPESKFIKTRAGIEKKVHYYATNRSNEERRGMAMFNVTPMEAAQYFHKIECFCFNEQSLNGKETAKMPIIFTIDPAIEDNPLLKNADTITLSYTFFPAEDLEE